MAKSSPETGPAQPQILSATPDMVRLYRSTNHVANAITREALDGIYNNVEFRLLDRPKSEVEDAIKAIEYAQRLRERLGSVGSRNDLNNFAVYFYGGGASRIILNHLIPHGLQSIGLVRVTAIPDVLALLYRDSDETDFFLGGRGRRNFTEDIIAQIPKQLTLPKRVISV